MSNHNSDLDVNTSIGISRRSILQTIGGLGAAGLAGVGSATTGGMGQLQTQGPSLDESPAILVFSATAGYRHGAIPTGNDTIKTLATEIGNENDTEITVDVIESDASQFPTSADELSQYDVVVWNSTTGDVLNDQQQTAFEQYIQNGGGYMGIHAAADTEYDWEFYGDLVGAYFESHPSQQTATVNVTDQSHSSTDHLPATWERYDEWYNYQENPRADVNVLATLDESSYDEGDGTPDQADDHPIAWYHTYEGARSWYTGMGHTTDSYSNEEFRQHLKGGLMWAAGYVNEWIQLFNGENLDNWTRKFSGHAPGEGYKNTFTVEDGLLTVNYDQYDQWNSTFGHLFYNEQEFSHYILRAEYRFVGEQVPEAPSWAVRNNGLMLHGQTPEEMDIDQDYPDSIEVQLLGGAADSDTERTTANVCTPGTHIVMDGELHTQHCTSSSSDTYRGDEWVTVTIVVRGNESIHHIIEDDGVVMNYTNPQLEDGTPLSDGTISIQSESHPTQFRSIEVKPLDPTDDDPIWSSYTKTELASSLQEPMALDIAPDGRVFFTNRGVDGGTARVGVIDPETTEITTALELDVYISGEDGLQGIVLDPEFEQNGWVYLYYSVPTSETGDDQYDRLSRFTVDGDTIDPDSETEILTVPSGPDPCCHVGGDLEFGPEGNLYISTGDDTSPFQSSGYTPIDERDGRELFDAQRSASNTNDLRGNILRITPQDDGSYTVPDGNLFTGEEYADARANNKVKTEIYVMGCRNPFRMGVDQETGVLYWGDYGPDARLWDAQRGPPGIVEFNRASDPGYYGWPYVIGPNIPYIDGQFATDDQGDRIFNSSGEPFDPQNLVNDSPNNDGLTQLPEPKEPALWYTYSWDALLDSPPEYAREYLPDEPPFPQLEGGAPMGGPVYRSDGESAALPEYLDGKQFIAEWGADWIKYVSYGANGEVLDINPFMPDETFLSPMEMAIGPEGAMYLLEYGQGYATPGTPDSGIYRIAGGAEGDDGDGPPSEEHGPPDHAGEQGPPDHAGEQGPPDHANGNGPPNKKK